MSSEIIDILNSHKCPEDILPNIYSYLTLSTRYVLSKKEFEKYYLKTSNCVKKSKNFDKYIKNIIRKDNLLCFTILIEKNFELWIKIKQFKGKIGVNHCKTNNYLAFVKELCIHFNAGRCKMKLVNYYKEKRPKKNKKLKKTKIKYTRWNN
jgi:hypothetical protein